MNVLTDYNSKFVTINDPIHIDNEDNYYCSLNYDNDLFNVKTNDVCYCFKNMEDINDKNYLSISLGKDYALFFQELYHFLVTLIYDKCDDWFEEPLTLSELENSFIFPLKSNIEKGTHDLKAFLDMNTFYVKDNLNNTLSISSFINQEILPTFHIKGITFNSKTFMLDVEVKNILVLTQEHKKNLENNEVDNENIENTENKEILEENTENKEDLEEYIIPYFRLR